jgi:ketosteroid isomerase-like protein
VAALISNDVVWPVPGSHPVSGEIHGRDDLLVWLGRPPSFGFWLREVEVFGNDRHVCAISARGASRDGVEVSTRVIRVFDYDDPESHIAHHRRQAGSGGRHPPEIP